MIDKLFDVGLLLVLIFAATSALYHLGQIIKSYIRGWFNE
tara:strand:+ start:7685 stop:7804 length:120 start_codon:yes stop_codon:yes gene_type:complete